MAGGIDIYRACPEHNILCFFRSAANQNYAAGAASVALTVTTLNPQPPVITTESLAGGTEGTAYSQSLTATGDDPITWELASGNLPGGLTLNADGTITGTPTAGGNFTFTVRAANGVDSVTKQLTIAITALVHAAQPNITAQPQGATVDIGGTVTLSVTASAADSGTLTYQWFRNTTNSGDGGTPVEGATSATFNAPTDTAGVFYYYVVITNTNNAVNGNTTATVTSAVVTVTVSEPAPTFTVSVTGGTANPASGTTGTVVTLTADTALAGQRFKEWRVVSGGVTIDADGKFVIGTDNVVIEAVWEKIPGCGGCGSITDGGVWGGMFLILAFGLFVLFAVRKFKRPRTEKA